MTDDTLALATRDGLPDALRVLMDSFPRDDWTAHPNFDQLVSFWLDRHMMFRKLVDMLRSDAQDLVDGRLPMQDYGARLSRFGGMFVNELHGHHQIEDHHYFPVLSRAETALSHGFEILDTDHHAIDATLNRFVERANAILQSTDAPDTFRDNTGRFAAEMDDVSRLLDRHLTDEEELVVPVLLKHGPSLFS